MTLTAILTRIGNVYNNAWSFILGPITRPIARRMGNTKDWSNESIFRGMVIGLILSKIGLYGMLFALLFCIKGILWWSIWLLWFPTAFGVNILLFMMITGWDTALEFKKEAKRV